jgi:HK97 family phage prohead protease
MRKITKLFTTQAKSINDETKTIRFKISDDQTDRMGEIVDQASWNFKNYMNNPIVLWGHNPAEPENVLGQTLALDTVGGETFAEMQFDDGINPRAALVWKQLLKGTLRTVSVGFISHDSEGNVLKDNELLEVSVVPIPANPRAIALSLKDGSLSRKDGLYLQDSMTKELAFIDEQLKETDLVDVETKDVNELKDQISALTELVGKVAGELTEVKTELATLSEARQGDADDQSNDDADKDDKGAQSGSDEGQDDKDDSANDGDNDQSGADEDEIDLDAELTPELEAQIEAELAESAA